ncbi:MAG: hypothetical protein IKY07_03410 [Clostridia bacterium]|nr:hypothetical protein [Clostridia bacterium]
MKSKILAAVIAVILTLPLLFACGNPASPEDGTTTAAAEASDTPAPEATTEEIDKAGVNNVPESLKYPDTVITILYWEDVERAEFFVEDENGESINDAIYRKNIRTQEGLGIELNWVGTKGNYGSQANFVTQAYNGSVSAEPYDAHAGYSLTASTLTTRGLTQNLKDFEILDFSKHWWPETLITAATINDKLYFCSGDISSNMLYMMYGCFFNKTLYESVHNGEAMPYTYVHEGDWTIDKLIELSHGAFEELTNDNVPSYGDRFGFYTIDLHFDCFFAGCGMVNLKKADDGSLQVSDDFTTQKPVDLLEKLVNFLSESGDAYAKGTTSNDSSSDMFAAGNAMFTVDRVYMTTFKSMKASDVKYGILPVPKYDKAQEKYITCMAFPYTMYSMASASQNKEATAATLQLMAYHCYDLVTPALFEETMKFRYSSEAEDSLMYDIIRGGVYIDLGRIFSTELSNITYSLWRDSVKSMNASSWSRQSSANLKRLDTALGKLNSTLAELN